MSREKQCVQRFCESGDEEAFRELYRLHAPGLYRMSCRMLGRSGEPAQDVVQETWMRAAKALPEFRWDSSLGTWLMGIAINRCREVLRQSHHPNGTNGSAVDLPGPVASEGLRLDLERAVARLAEGYREVLLLHDVEGYTHQEIGTVLGIAPGTSKSQLSRARRLLREMLRPALADAPQGEGHGE
jgi:RNA polymerase sigma factor (sigma-70 family)